MGCDGPVFGFWKISKSKKSKKEFDVKPRFFAVLLSARERAGYRLLFLSTAVGQDHSPRQQSVPHQPLKAGRQCPLVGKEIWVALTGLLALNEKQISLSLTPISLLPTYRHFTFSANPNKEQESTFLFQFCKRVGQYKFRTAAEATAMANEAAGAMLYKHSFADIVDGTSGVGKQLAPLRTGKRRLLELPPPRRIGSACDLLAPERQQQLARCQTAPFETGGTLFVLHTDEALTSAAMSARAALSNSVVKVGLLYLLTAAQERETAAGSANFPKVFRRVQVVCNALSSAKAGFSALASALPTEQPRMPTPQPISQPQSPRAAASASDAEREALLTATAVSPSTSGDRAAAAAVTAKAALTISVKQLSGVVGLLNELEGNSRVTAAAVENAKGLAEAALRGIEELILIV